MWRTPRPQTLFCPGNVSSLRNIVDRYRNPQVQRATVSRQPFVVFVLHCQLFHHRLALPWARLSSEMKSEGWSGKRSRCSRLIRIKAAELPITMAKSGSATLQSVSRALVTCFE